MQAARPCVYTTAAPPALADAATCSIALVRGADGDARRARLNARVAQLRNGLAAILADRPRLGWRLPGSFTPIQALVVGDNATALRLSERLEARGVWVTAIRPPTVPQGSARLRIALSAAHGENDVARLLDALAAAAAGSRRPHERAAGAGGATTRRADRPGLRAGPVSDLCRLARGRPE